MLFAPNDLFAYDAKAIEKNLSKGEGAGYAVLAELRALLAEADWTLDALESLLNGFCERRQLGMGKVAQPIRVAVTGSTISPPIGDTLVLLGRENTLARIDRCLAGRVG